MSISLNLDDQKGKLLLSALQAFLARAVSEVELAQKELNAAQQRLEDAQAVFTEYDELIKETAASLGVDFVVTVSPCIQPWHNHFITDLQGEKKPSFREELRGVKHAIKRRETVDEITLKLLIEANAFKTVDQIIEMVLAFYGEGEVKEKTVKNALWSLSGYKIKKHYSRDHRGYIYGLLTWYDGDGNPKPDYVEPLDSSGHNLDDYSYAMAN